MGFFSFITSDTKKSIPNVHTNKRLVPVTMIDDEGNKYFEDQYEGYGVFGGKDFYALVDEMNGGDGNRDMGIKLFHPPSTIDPNQYPKDHYVNILNPDNGEYQPHSISDYNKIVEDFLEGMPSPVKVPILVQDASIEWSSDLRPEICPYQGYWY